jgi:diguanylate cyclase (GGDEF)-like protein
MSYNQIMNESQANQEIREIDDINSFFLSTNTNFTSITNINIAFAARLHAQNPQLPTNPFEYFNTPTTGIFDEISMELFQIAGQSITYESPIAEIEYSYTNPNNGETIHTGWTMTGKFNPVTKELGRFILLGTNITEKVISQNEKTRQAEKLAFEANHDPLTGLYNRNFYNEQLHLAAASRFPVAICMIDLDFFKEINDTLGHPAGDTHLIEVAEFLSLQFRQGDVLARIGGDEFAVIISGSDLCEEVIQRKTMDIKTKLELLNQIRTKNGLPPLKMSFAFALAKNDFHNGLLDVVGAHDAADQKMYQIKERSKEMRIDTHELEDRLAQVTQR